MDINLTNQFLIAMPNLLDPNFNRSVTYICDHNEEGAMGITINRPLNINLGEILQQMNIESTDPLIEQLPIYAGGPVNVDQGFIIHEPSQKWQATLVTSDSIAITMSQDILHDLARGAGPAKNLISLGYAGWDAGQLENEIKENCWITVPADPKIIFDYPAEQRWSAACQKLGFDINALSNDIGHG